MFCKLRRIIQQIIGGNHLELRGFHPQPQKNQTGGMGLARHDQRFVPQVPRAYDSLSCQFRIFPHHETPSVLYRQFDIIIVGHIGSHQETEINKALIQFSRTSSLSPL